MAETKPRKYKYKPFSLREGDEVWFRSESRGLLKGTLLKRPYGRRLFAVIRDESNKVHYVPSREHIVRKATDD